ncbi:uncharacterized membrane protein HdeD (DUF308 family) [Microbacterium resistens]|uniref:Uncharacterized membrane protein HdeD (DUF308 family) n=1 Tax=Microbacterium resistens TaxID=156977 RepID=A0ABU1SF10_9MICO|nr:DUF308 domain-containing protein [Microbacterium resistens]MDR6868205.1 uncharacterized membrane protein HdeD (DUF308 family) [Microbacterium resistens]
MTDPLAGARSLVKSLRAFLVISGVIALIAGLVLLIWPAKTAIIVTGIFAAYLIIGGVVYLGLGIFSGGKGGWARVGHILLGLLYIAAGIIAFANLGAATASLALIVAIFIGVSWIFDGFVSLTLLGNDGARAWTMLYAILSILAGIFVLFSPLYAAAVLWLVLGISAVALGVVQIVRAITLGRAAGDVESVLEDRAV